MGILFPDFEFVLVSCDVLECPWTVFGQYRDAEVFEDESSSWYR